LPRRAFAMAEPFCSGLGSKRPLQEQGR